MKSKLLMLLLAISLVVNIITIRQLVIMKGQRKQQNHENLQEIGDYVGLYADDLNRYLTDQDPIILYEMKRCYDVLRKLSQNTKPADGLFKDGYENKLVLALGDIIRVISNINLRIERQADGFDNETRSKLLECAQDLGVLSQLLGELCRYVENYDSSLRNKNIGSIIELTDQMSVNCLYPQ
jgi:hypothetical protein